jgi:two-component system, OmpR family, sensor kinase
VTLRTRLIFSFVLIIVLCLLLSGLSVSAVLRNYRDQQVFTQLDTLTRPLANQVKNLLNGQITSAQAWDNIRQLSTENNAYIIIVDDKGIVIRQAAPDVANQVLAVPGGLPHKATKERNGIFTTADRQQFIYSAYPLPKNPETPKLRQLTLIICQPRTAPALIQAGVFRPLILTGLIALVISVLLAFFLARSVYRPIMRISKAAQNISQGNYEDRVPVSGPPDLKVLAASFNEMAGKVQESQQHLRHFVADVSHQLKSPLTSIQGFAQAMLDGTASDEESRQKAARIINDESRRMIQQVNELLELSRMQAGQVKMNLEPVSIQEILTQCQEILSLRLEEKKIELKNQFGPAPEVEADADRLEDVFANLLDNAIKNTPPLGQIKVRLRSTGTQVEVTITDSGPGIPPEQILHIFERFQQGAGLRTGFGLGLAIAREIVVSHGGHIEAASQPGEGAEFKVILPIKHLPAEK